MPGKTETTAPTALLIVVRHVLRPLAKLMLAKGITYPLLTNLLKSLFVEVAEQEFKLDRKSQTDSRISLLSGVHRKDVKRLRRQETANHVPPEAVSLGAQLVAAWTGLPRYLDRHGSPKPLPRLASGSGSLSFEGLVESISKDIRSRAVLDEWLRLGVAHVDEEDCVCLNVDAFIPEKGFEEKAYYFGHSLHDHAAAGIHNLLGQKPPFLERIVHYDSLSPGSVEKLSTLSEKLGMQALKEVNRQALQLEKKDASKADAGQRITFGVYFFNTPANTGKADEEK